MKIFFLLTLGIFNPGESSLTFYSSFLWNDIKEEFAVFAGKTSLFSYALSFNYLNYGKVEGRDTFGFKTSDFTPYDFALHLGFARNFSKFLKIGLASGFAIEEIEKERGNSFLFSIGAKYILPANPSFKLGFSLLNLGTPVKFIEESFYPPIILKFGFLYKTKASPYFISSEISFPFDDIPFLSMGGAYNIKDIFELRCGFKTSFDAGPLSALRFGFGLKFLPVILDYALVPQGVLGLTYHIDLKLQF